MRATNQAANPPPEMRIQVPEHVAANFEGLIARVSPSVATGGADHLWKIVRSFDDPATWTEPNIRHLATDGPMGPAYRVEPLPDEWELYDLDADPIETKNRESDPAAAAILAHLKGQLSAERTRCVPNRNQPWPYAKRIPKG